MLPSRLWPTTATGTRLPPSPRKMPWLPVPPVMFARNAVVPLVLISAGSLNEENAPAPVSGAIWPWTAILVKAPPAPVIDARRRATLRDIGQKRRRPAVVQCRCAEGQEPARARARALCPCRAMFVKLPPEPVKMPSVAVPPETPATNATVPSSLLAQNSETVESVPVPVPGALCPVTAIAVKLPPEPLKMPRVAVPPVTSPLNAAVPPAFNSGTLNEENVPPPVLGASALAARCWSNCRPSLERCLQWRCRR